MKHLILIDRGLFNISERIKKINNKLCVFYNKKTETFQIYSKFFSKYEFEVDLGKNLNQKAIKIVFEQRAENIKRIVEKMDRENKKIEDNLQKNRENLSKDMLKEFLNYADKKNTDVDFFKIK